MKHTYDYDPKLKFPFDSRVGFLVPSRMRLVRLKSTPGPTQQEGKTHHLLWFYVFWLAFL